MAISIFDYADYREFVRERVEQLPRHGHGQYRRMAKHMRVHTTLLSHVFGGKKDLTPEQACGLASFLELPELEADYLLALVERNRAGSTPLKRALERRLSALRERHQEVEHRLPGARTLSREDRATFYSQWYYSAIRLVSSLPGMRDAESIAQRLGLPGALVQSTLEFLLSVGLIAKQDDGYALLAKRTDLGASSPLVSAHHRNWRAQVMSRYESMTRKDFAFTAPITLSLTDFARVRELLVEAVGGVTGIVEPSEPQTLAVLNIDWVRL
ncbi:MAG: hypothetical protein K0R38_406 [Polyangiaceae bacterium]|jgi:uncharacterized protein (TIGR02147 family)|nr:hypothetical protein [Polyangiaceae bacterium]